MRLNTRVTIEEDVSDDGDSDPSYHAAILDVPAHIQQISGDETYRGRQLQGHVDYVVTIWRQEVNNRHRLRIKTGWLRDRLLNISEVRELLYRNGKPPMLELYCREVTP